MYSLEKVREFSGFQIYFCFGRLTAEMRAELIQFWLANGAITDSYEAWRRTLDIGCVVLNAEGRIVGVSSVYIDRLVKEGPTYWFYRTFIRSDCRVFGLISTIFHSTFDGLSRLYSGESGSPSGVVAVTENPKLESRGGMRVLQRGGLERIGTDQQGQSIWRKCFPGIAS